MRTPFIPKLINGVSGDPALWIDLIDEGRSILLDLGDLHGWSTRKLLRVERVVVTHTHVDHFIGFDHLMRLVLGRDKELTLTGPPGFIDRVAGRLAGYTWNLIESYPVRLVAEEVHGDFVRATAFSGAGALQPEPLEDRPFDGTLWSERLYTMRTATLDHGIPVLAVALCETESFSVNKDRVRRLGLVPGEWLRELKLAAWNRLPAETPIDADTESGERKRFLAGELIDEMLFPTPGQKLAYVTDTAYTPDNVDRIVELARNADLMICDAAFLHADRKLAEERMHLTARQAGEIARAAAARRLVPFHFSPRYSDRYAELTAEAAEAFGGPILTL